MIKVFWEQEKGQDDHRRGFIERIELPSGNTVHFDEVDGRINFEPCRPFIGSQLELFRNGVSVGISELEDIAENDEGVLAIWFTRIEEDALIDEEPLLN